ncbi:DUF4861 family protein [uncultured Alistipes sp.]|jgi:hypothetical protein|uniref:DUF4861 family protein n=1 Tax=uncultured Alistipes sp. TaxID=538949 RepID=UPI0025ED0A05|nr:DUF4861 family protein [uncultured Alistipes sp.]
MKKTLLLLAAAFFASCTQSLQVEVTNNTRIEREDETVEIAWSEIAALKGVTPENVVVFDDEGEQVPSQVIYFGQTEPQSLIFQADVDGSETEYFTIRTGDRESYRTKAYGRHVPERLDDYAWENNKVAYRLYGPALENSTEKLVTPGIDVWVKSTEKLVIDDWYAKGDYHHNYGDGMDAYKVGVTLGAGASAPFTSEKLWLSNNYATQQTLDNGPIRTTVKLTYAPFDVDGKQLSLTKYISLDADKRFNRMENIYEGDFTEMPIAAGFVRHDVDQVQYTTNYLALCEAVSDSDNPARDGDIYLGVILPGADFWPDTAGHALAVKNVKPGEKFVYWAGSGWSRGGVDDMDDWLGKIEEQTAGILAPLQVIIRK